jgi:hypothetical protein
LCETKNFVQKQNEIRQNFCYLLLSLLLSLLLKVDRKILVSFRQIQNFEILDLAMAKVEKVNITVT